MTEVDPSDELKQLRALNSYIKRTANEELREAQRLLATAKHIELKNEKLASALTALRREHNAQARQFTAVLQQQTDTQAALAAALTEKFGDHAELQSAAAALKTANLSRWVEEIGQLQANILGRNDTIANLRDQIAGYREQLIAFAPMRPLMRIMEFGKAVADAIPDTADGLYLRGMQPLAALPPLAGRPLKRIINDCIEAPDFGWRSGKIDWNDQNLDAINRYLSSLLAEVDCIFAISKALAQSLQERYTAPIAVLPNYRNFAPPPEPNDFRASHGIPDDAIVVLSVGMLASPASDGFAAVLEALRRNGPNWRLVSVGRIASSELEAEILAAAKSMDMADRVHLLPPAPYRELAACCAASDIGVYWSDPAIGNISIALPNRIFDFLAGGLPFVSTSIPDIAEIVTDHNCGRIVATATADAWSKALQAIHADAATYRAAAVAANAALTWSTQTETIHKAFAPIDHAAFVGVNDLSLNNRAIRIALALLQHGKRVTFMGSTLKHAQWLQKEGIGCVQINAKPLA